MLVVSDGVAGAHRHARRRAGSGSCRGARSTGEDWPLRSDAGAAGRARRASSSSGGSSTWCAHFIVFEDDGGGTLVKKMAGYHQFHAVNVAVEETLRAANRAPEAEEAAGRYAPATARRRAGRPARRRRLAHAGLGQEPDDGVLRRAGHPATRRWRTRPSSCSPTATTSTTSSSARSRAATTCCARRRCRPTSRGRSRANCSTVASGGVVFTTIQKFFPEEKGDRHPVLSDRRNIVVIADEAHRSQYDFIDGFARHMRDALPNASFIGFTGTPIEMTDANTRAVFGDYISVYDIQRAVEDGATVPIYYESRLAKLELKPRPSGRRSTRSSRRSTEGEEVERKEKLKTKWAQLEAVVGAEKRVELIAEDLVEHFEKRLDGDGRQGDDRLHEPAHLRRPVRRDRRAAARLARRGRRRRARSRS